MEIRLQDEPTYRWHGRMDFVDNALDTGSGTIRGRAVVANPEHFLTPGMFGHMRLLGSGTYRALLIPDQAVVTDQERQMVYVVGAGRHRAGRARWSWGRSAAGCAWSARAVRRTTEVVIDGVQRAQAGQKVAARQMRIEAGPAADDDAAAATPPPASTAEPVGRCDRTTNHEQHEQISNPHDPRLEPPLDSPKRTPAH